MEDPTESGDAAVLRKPFRVLILDEKKKRIPSKRTHAVPASGSSSSSSPKDSSRGSVIPDSRHGSRKSGVRFSSKSNIVSYDCRVPAPTPALLIGSHPLRVDSSDYFEIEVLEMHESSNLGIGLVPYNHPLDQYPGMGSLSFGFNAGTGRVHWGHCAPAIAVHGNRVSRTARPGDRIGCAIKKERVLFPRDQSNNEPIEEEPQVLETRVYFFLNGKRIASNTIPQSIVHNDFYPVIALSSPGDEVKLLLNHHFVKRRDVASLTNKLESLSLDHESNSTHEDTFAEGTERDEPWLFCSHIRASDSILEYFSQGKEIGVCQAKDPLDQFSHYFQAQVLDVGQCGSISIGVTQCVIPLQSKPGTYPLSVAFHLDSGLIFTGSSKGEAFGPKGAVTGDIIGCGIVFPLVEEPRRETAEKPKVLELEEDKSFSPSPSHPSEEEASEEGDLSDSDKEPKISTLPAKSTSPEPLMVDVFFTRNGVLLGQRNVEYPSEGFYPVIGLSSPAEKVVVDLHPLSG
jgi:hypothetical protein